MADQSSSVPSRSTRSRFDDDPRMRSIVERFKATLEGRTQDLDRALQASDLDRLASMAHQLKGTAGGYGFDSIGEAAADLEQETIALEADLSSVRERVENLIILCRSVSGR